MLGDFDRHVAENNIADGFLRCSCVERRPPEPVLAFQSRFSCGLVGDGAYRDRTGDLRLAKPALSQLS
jgi:hypothetical protein